MYICNKTGKKSLKFSFKVRADIILDISIRMNWWRYLMLFNPFSSFFSQSCEG
jgi:hypothetical protein